MIAWVFGRFFLTKGEAASFFKSTATPCFPVKSPWFQLIASNLAGPVSLAMRRGANNFLACFFWPMQYQRTSLWYRRQPLGFPSQIGMLSATVCLDGSIVSCKSPRQNEEEPHNDDKVQNVEGLPKVHKVDVKGELCKSSRRSPQGNSNTSTKKQSLVKEQLYQKVAKGEKPFSGLDSSKAAVTTFLNQRCPRSRRAPFLPPPDENRRAPTDA